MSIYPAVKRLLPAALVHRHKDSLRWILSRFYVGTRRECTICGFMMRRFIVLSDGGLLCPRCGSLGRTRRLWSILKEIVVSGQAVLHFSPPTSLRKKMTELDGVSYITTDFEGEFSADLQLDITQMDVASQSYDLIICYHVLEHIEDDQQAMTELYRITKAGGRCIIQTPFRQGSIYENSKIHSPEDRLRHFGQRDHVRIYSAGGLADRLRAAGFEVDIQRRSSPADNRYGYKSEDVILIASKADAK